MPNKIIKEYFSFTKKERIGVIVLVFLIIVIFLIPYLLPKEKEEINKAEWEQFKSQSAQLLKAEESSKTFSGHPDEPYAASKDSRSNQQKYMGEFNKFGGVKSELFYFDPNTLAEKGWERLGLRSKTISTIQNYLSKGGRFRRSDDLGKIYGLQKNELERLLPYVKIQGPVIGREKNINSQVFHKNYLPYSQPAEYHTTSISIVDLNAADTAQLIALPGIGSKLATRIIHFREKLGAFYSIDQLLDVYGLPDSTFQNLRSRLTVSEKTLRMVNINTADVNELKQLPYFQWNAARAVVEFRNQHGDYKSLDELLQIELLTAEMLKKMAPYLLVR